MSRTVDALDRATAVTYPTPELNVAYTYDDPAVSFSKGRLTQIARGTSTVSYAYDRFGRLTPSCGASRTRCHLSEGDLR